MNISIKKIAISLTLTLFFILTISSAMAHRNDDLIIVITDTQLESESTQGWLNFLARLGVTSKLVKPEDFETVKGSMHIALMAVPGVPELNGDILPLLLDEKEIAWLSEPGNRKFYYLDDSFIEGQAILLFAGATQRATEIVRQNNRADWELIFCSWFDLAISSLTLTGY